MEEVGENHGESKARGPGNWFAVCRELFAHPVVGAHIKPLNAQDPTRHAWPPTQAWVWLIAEAAWEDRKQVLMGNQIRIKRGQVSHSYRYLARRFNWTEKGAREWLKRLERFGMIETVSSLKQFYRGAGHGARNGAACNIITICNYDIYQKAERSDGAGQGAGQGARGAQQGRSKGAKRNKETSEHLTSRSSSIQSNRIDDDSAKPVQLSPSIVETLKTHVGQQRGEELAAQWRDSRYGRNAQIPDRAFIKWLQKTYGIVISGAGDAAFRIGDALDLCPKDERGRPVTKLPTTVSVGDDDWKARARAKMNGGAH